MYHNKLEYAEHNSTISVNEYDTILYVDSEKLAYILHDGLDLDDLGYVDY